jgi:hypothetical protein
LVDMFKSMYAKPESKPKEVIRQDVKFERLIQSFDRLHKILIVNQQST